MLLHCWSVYPCSSSSSLKLGLGSLQNLLIGFKNPKPSYTPTRPRAQFSQEIAQLVQNKVLIAAGASAAIGQLSKPFTSVLLYGRDFDLKAAIQAGGFPSTHSSAVVATATCLGLERGLSDSIFGLTVVYAGLIMYDAQGVRREVGIHAKTLNKILQAKPEANNNNTNNNNNIPTRKTDTIDYCQPGILESRGPKLSKEGRYVTSKPANALLVSKSENETKQSNEVQIPCGVAGDIVEERNMNSFGSTYPLKESIGHTEVEVAAGALLGFLQLAKRLSQREKKIWHNGGSDDNLTNTPEGPGSKKVPTSALWVRSFVLEALFRVCLNWVIELFDFDSGKQLKFCSKSYWLSLSLSLSLSLCIKAISCKCYFHVH